MKYIYEINFVSHSHCLGVPLPDESDSTDSETDNPYSNSAIDIDLKPISIENLWNYIKEKKASRTEGFRYEYDVSLTCKVQCVNMKFKFIIIA